MSRLAFLLCLLAAAPSESSAQLSGSQQQRLGEAVIQHEQVMIRVRSLRGGYVALHQPRLEGAQLVGRIQSGTVFGEPTYSPVSYPLYQVQEIRVRSGRHHWEGLALGAATGLTLVALLHTACNNDPSCSEPDEGYPAVYGLGAASFGLLGLVGGVLVPKWLYIYTRGVPLEIIASAYPQVSHRSASMAFGLRVALGGVSSR